MLRPKSRSHSGGPAAAGALRGGASKRQSYYKKGVSVGPSVRFAVKHETSPSRSQDRGGARAVKQEPSPTRSASSLSDRPGYNRRSPRGSHSPPKLTDNQEADSVVRSEAARRASSRSRDRSQSQSRMGAVPLHVRGDTAQSRHGVPQSSQDAAELRRRAAQSVAQREAAGDRGYVLPNRGFSREAFKMRWCFREGRSIEICHLFNGWGCHVAGEDVQDKFGRWHTCPQGCCLSSSGAVKAHGCIRCGKWGHSHTHCDMHRALLPDPQIVSERDLQEAFSGARPSRFRDEHGDLPQGHRERMREEHREEARSSGNRDPVTEV